MNNNGWVKLYRKLRYNPIYSNSKALHCWVECLLRANHNKDKFYLGRKQIELNSGEFIFGREEFGRSINISGSTAWFWIQRFEVDRMIDIKKTSKGCLCSIINWKDYQDVDSKADRKKTANEQQMNTDKNDKNIKNYNKESRNFVPPSLEEVKQYCEERKNNIDPNGFINFYESKGWLIGKNKMKDWCAAIRTWEQREEKKPHENNGIKILHDGTKAILKFGQWVDEKDSSVKRLTIITQK